MKIDVVETELEHVDFTCISYGMGEGAEASGDEWIDCKKEGSQFVGFGGPFKLIEILDVFLNWANKIPSA